MANLKDAKGWQEGFKAGLLGLKPQNPYPPNSEAANYYSSGFVDGRGIRSKQVAFGSLAGMDYSSVATR